MTERLYYVSVGGEPGRGPVSEGDLRRDLASGKLAGEALVCEVGSGAWRSIASLDSPDAPAPVGPMPPQPPPLPPVASLVSPAPRVPPDGRGAGRRPWLAIFLVTLGVFIVGGVATLLVMTHHPKPKLCPGTPALLASLHQELLIDAYVTRGLPTLDKFDRELEALLSEYQRNGSGHMRYRVIDVKDEDTRKRAKDLGLAEQPFGEMEDSGDALLREGFSGLVFSYGAERDVIKYLPPDQTEGLAFWIDNKIRELRAKGDGRVYRIGILTGHGEIAPSESNLVPSSAGAPSMQSVITQNFSFYSLRDENTANGVAPIEPALDGLVVTQPSSAVPEADLRRIDDFVMHGKAVAFFVGAANVRASDPTMTATLDTHGLERLLSGYGIELHRDVVIDPGSHVSLAVQTMAGGGAKVSLPFIPVAKAGRASGEPRLDPAFPVFFRLTEVALPLASSLDVHRETQPEATMRVVARSSPTALRLTDATVDLHPLKPWRPSGPEGQVVLAAAVEGTLRSAFDASKRSEHPARVLVVASAQFLANPLARAGNPPNAGQVGMMMPSLGGDEQLLTVATPYAQSELTTSIIVFKNTIDWLSSEDELVGCLPAYDAGK
jgi:ABC-type uncharacterized transport system involved in gliding motility auxiliary subunit